MGSLFKKYRNKIRTFNIVFDMFLRIEKGIRRGICHTIQRYSKTNKKYMKNYNKNKE